MIFPPAGLSKEGWYILKNFWTEIAICSLGYLTYVPAVQVTTSLVSEENGNVSDPYQLV